MVYLLSLRKYFFTFLKTVLFFAAGLLLYLFNILIFLKFKGESSILIEALKNYALFLVYSFPFITIIASGFYFSFIGTDKMFTIRMIPIISAFNTIVLLIFFLVNFDFLILSDPSQLYFKPEVRDGIVNTVGDYKIYFEKGGNKGEKRGILFYKNAYLINDWQIKDNEVRLSAYQYIGDNSFFKQNSSFSIPRKEPVLQLKETGITHFLFQNYISYLKKLREIFYTTFASDGILASIIAILFLCTGYFTIISGISGFINEKQLIILTYSTLLITVILMFLCFPYFLSLITLIKFGIKNGFFKVIIPGLFIGLFSALIGYGLLELGY